MREALSRRAPRRASAGERVSGVLNSRHSPRASSSDATSARRALVVPTVLLSPMFALQTTVGHAALIGLCGTSLSLLVP